MSEYFADLDLSEANEFQRQAAARFVEFFDQAGLAAIPPERTHSEWTDRGRMLWLIVDNAAQPRFDLSIVIEQAGSVVVNVGPDHEHFGYGYEEDELAPSALESALRFVDAVVDGRVEFKIHRRGSIEMKTVITAVDRGGEILIRMNDFKFASLIGPLLAPFLRKSTEIVVIRFG